MFKVNNRNNRTWRRFGVFIVNLEHISLLCSSTSIVNFDQVNSGWLMSCYEYETLYAIWYHFCNLKNVKNTLGALFNKATSF